MKNNNLTIQDILNLLKKYLKITDFSLVTESFNYVKTFIDDESLLNDYLEIASILTTVYADIETISSSFLYHLLVLEKVTDKEIREKYNLEVSKLVIGAYKLDKIIYSTENDYLVEYYKKVIVGMSEDVRVIMINLANRVMNMRHISRLKREQAKKYAKESLEIVAPIAHHLGIYKIKSELEDLSLKTLKPDVYFDIVEKLNSTKNEREKLIQSMTREVKKILDDNHINYEIKGRSKSIYSIYNKLDKGRKFNDIYDLFALRIMVSDEILCYHVLGLIHAKFKPIPKRFKDFIAMPKSNGYRSLHTTVFGVNNTLFEIQIRTFEMNEVAENGLAAHWSYKENRSAATLSSTDQKLEFFKTVIDNYQLKADQANAFDEFKDEKMHGNIYVFTPKGDVIELPNGATPIDFAYKVHTKVGEEMVGAIVNNKIVPLNYTLQDNDVVKINTNKSSSPKLSWLKIAKLNQTKNKIKSYFVKERKEEIIEFGEYSLVKYLKKKNISQVGFFKEENIQKILKELKCKDLNDLYLNIGNNKFSPKTVCEIIYPSKEENKHLKKDISIKNNTDIHVAGISDIHVNIASCCNPIPNDEIVGFITKNNGITIHRKNCSNIKKTERLIDVTWSNSTKNMYLSRLKIYTNDSSSHLTDIISKISNLGIVINNAITCVNNLKFNYELSFYVRNTIDLENIIKMLSKLDYVVNIERG